MHCLNDITGSENTRRIMASSEIEHSKKCRNKILSLLFIWEEREKEEAHSWRVKPTFYTRAPHLFLSRRICGGAGHGGRGSHIARAALPSEVADPRVALGQRSVQARTASPAPCVSVVSALGFCDSHCVISSDIFTQRCTAPSPYIHDCTAPPFIQQFVYPDIYRDLSGTDNNNNGPQPRCLVWNR